MLIKLVQKAYADCMPYGCIPMGLSKGITSSIKPMQHRTAQETLQHPRKPHKRTTGTRLRTSQRSDLGCTTVALKRHHLIVSFNGGSYSKLNTRPTLIALSRQRRTGMKSCAIPYCLLRVPASGKVIEYLVYNASRERNLSASSPPKKLKVPELPPNIIRGSITSVESISPHYKFYLTGGLTAFSPEFDSDYVQLYPLNVDGKASFGPKIRIEQIAHYVADLGTEIIGLKEVTLQGRAANWRWSPQIRRGDAPPANNPRDKWQRITHSLQHLESDEGTIQSAISSSNPVDIKALIRQSQNVSLSLHHLNWAIVTIAEHFQAELSSAIANGDELDTRYSTTRDHDLFAYVHAFFQAYGAARDHYAFFLAHQLGSPERKTKRGVQKHDSLSNLLSGISATDLRTLPMIANLEKREILKPDPQTSRFVITKETWLGFSNELRNRFTHRSPLGTLAGEDVNELIQLDGSSNLWTIKRYLQNPETSADAIPVLDLLRTLNGNYRHMCYFFWDAAELTGLETPPPTIRI